jgi:hypothetical protein
MEGTSNAPSHVKRDSKPIKYGDNGLKPPSDEPDQVLLVAAPAFFFEDLFVALDQLANRFVLQLSDFEQYIWAH